MTNKPHSREKKVSNTAIKVKKKPLNISGKKTNMKEIISSLIKKPYEK